MKTNNKLKIVLILLLLTTLTGCSYTGFAVLENQIPTIEINKNSGTQIDLLNYFSGDNLTFSVLPIHAINITIEGSIAKLTPLPNFTGTQTTIFTVYENGTALNSDVVTVNVINLENNNESNQNDFSIPEIIENIIEINNTPLINISPKEELFEISTTPSFRTSDIQESENIPSTLSIQGKLTNASNTRPVNDGNYNLTFKIYNGSGDDNHIWIETHSNIPIFRGVYSLILGSLNATNITFNKTLYLGIEVNSDGEMSPRINLTNSPYSQRSLNSYNVSCSGCVDWTTEIANIPADLGTGNLSSPWANDSNSLYIKNTYAQNINLSGNLSITGFINITGNAFINNLNISGVTFANGNIQSNNITATENLTVNKNALIQGNLTINENLTVSKNITTTDLLINNLLTLFGTLIGRGSNATLYNLSISDNLDVGGNITVINITATNISTTRLTATTLNVTGQSYLNNLNISGVTFANGTIEGINITAKGNLSVQGISDLNNLTAQHTLIQENLTVIGNTILNMGINLNQSQGAGADVHWFPYQIPSLNTGLDIYVGSPQFRWKVLSQWIWNLSADGEMTGQALHLFGDLNTSDGIYSRDGDGDGIYWFARMPQIEAPNTGLLVDGVNSLFSFDYLGAQIFNISVTGDIYGEDAVFNENVTINENLTVKGTSVFGNDIIIKGNATISLKNRENFTAGALFVNNSLVNITGDLGISGLTLSQGNIQANNITANENLTVKKETLIEGNLTVNENTQIKENLASEAYYDPIDDDLVLYLPFTKNSTTITKDKSRFANDGTVTNAKFNSSGKFGNAYSLDGSGDYIEKTVANWQSGDNIGTISAWINRAETGVQHTIFGSSDTEGSVYFITFRIWTSDVISMGNRNNDVADRILGSTTLNANEWYHVVVTTDGSAYKLYVNGLEESLTVDTGVNNGDWFNDIINRDNIAVGVLKRDTEISPFKGKIDEVKVWNRTLSIEEIRSLYNKGQNNRIENLTVNDTLIVTTLNVTGQSYLNNLNISGVTFANGNIQGNNITATENLTVNKNALIQGNLTINENLTVSKNITTTDLLINNILTLFGTLIGRGSNATLLNLSISDNLDVGGNITVVNITATNISTTDMKITNKLGIGINNPTQAIDISQTGDARIILKSSAGSSGYEIDSANNQNSFIKFEEDGTQKWQFFNDGDDSDKLNINDDGNTRITFTQTGRMGLATTTPLSTLYVTGNTTINMTNSENFTAGALFVNNSLVNITGRLRADNLTSFSMSGNYTSGLPCSQITGGPDTDFCTDANTALGDYINKSSPQDISAVKNFTAGLTSNDVINLSSTGNIIMSGNITSYNITATNISTTDLVVNNLMKLGTILLDNLNTGWLSIVGNLTIGGDLNITGNTTIHENLNVSKNITATEVTGGYISLFQKGKTAGRLNINNDYLITTDVTADQTIWFVVNGTNGLGTGTEADPIQLGETLVPVGSITGNIKGANQIMVKYVGVYNAFTTQAGNVMRIGSPDYANAGMAYALYPQGVSLVNNIFVMVDINQTGHFKTEQTVNEGAGDTIDYWGVSIFGYVSNP